MVNRKVTRKTKKQNRQLPKSAPRRHKEHKLAWIVAFAALGSIAVIVLINVFKPINFQSSSDSSSPITTTDTPSSDSPASSSSSQSSGSQSSSEEPSEQPAEQTTASDGTPLVNEGSNPNSSANLTGVISFAAVSDGNLVIRATIDQYLTSGSCNLTLTSNTISGVSYTRIANIVPTVSSSSCDGFDIPVDELRSGNYLIHIDLDSSEKTGYLERSIDL